MDSAFGTQGPAGAEGEQGPSGSGTTMNLENNGVSAGVPVDVINFPDGTAFAVAGTEATWNGRSGRAGGRRDIYVKQTDGIATVNTNTPVPIPANATDYAPAIAAGAQINAMLAAVSNGPLLIPFGGKRIAAKLLLVADNNISGDGSQGYQGTFLIPMSPDGIAAVPSAIGWAAGSQTRGEVHDIGIRADHLHNSTVWAADFQDGGQWFFGGSFNITTFASSPNRTYRGIKFVRGDAIHMQHLISMEHEGGGHGALWGKNTRGSMFDWSNLEAATGMTRAFTVSAYITDFDASEEPIVDIPSTGGGASVYQYNLFGVIKIERGGVSVIDAKANTFLKITAAIATIQLSPRSALNRLGVHGNPTTYCVNAGWANIVEACSITNWQSSRDISLGVTGAFNSHPAFPVDAAGSRHIPGGPSGTPNEYLTFLRVVANSTTANTRNGVAVVEQIDEATGVISGATQANPVVITSTAHGYSNGQRVFISGVNGMTQLNGNTYTLANVAANTFELSGIDGTAFGAYTNGGTAARLTQVSNSGEFNFLVNQLPSSANSYCSQDDFTYVTCDVAPARGRLRYSAKVNPLTPGGATQGSAKLDEMGCYLNMIPNGCFGYGSTRSVGTVNLTRVNATVVNDGTADWFGADVNDPVDITRGGCFVVGNTATVNHGITWTVNGMLPGRHYLGMMLVKVKDADAANTLLLTTTGLRAGFGRGHSGSAQVQSHLPFEMGVPSGMVNTSGAADGSVYLQNVCAVPTNSPFIAEWGLCTINNIGAAYICWNAVVCIDGSPLMRTYGRPHWGRWDKGVRITENDPAANGFYEWLSTLAGDATSGVGAQFVGVDPYMPSGQALSAWTGGTLANGASATTTVSIPGSLSTDTVPIPWYEFMRAGTALVAAYASGTNWTFTLTNNTGGNYTPTNGTVGGQVAR